MRGRPQVKVALTEAIFSGSTMKVEVALSFADETPTDYIDLVFSGTEFAGVGAGKSRRTESRDIVNLVRRFDGKTFSAGTYTYEAEFHVPMYAPPSHTGSDAFIRYDLLVHVSIPWWPDRRANYVVPVRFPQTEPYAPVPQIFASAAEARGGQPQIELSVDTADITVGEVLRGQIAVSDLGSRTCRGVDVLVVETELVKHPDWESRVANRWSRRVFHGRPGEAESIPFSLLIPESAHPTFSGQLYGVNTALEVACDIQLGSDIKLSAPLVVRPVLTEPRKKSADLVAPVGNGRLDRIFSVVAGRLALNYEQGQRKMRGRGGVVAFQISLVHTQNGYARLAEYSYPDLGCDLIVEQKTFDNLYGIKAKSFERLPNYAVTVREDAQAASLVECIGRRTNVFSKMHFSDQAGTAYQDGDASTVLALTSFSNQAIDFANSLSEAIAKIPAPAGMIAAVPAWQAFAERIEGVFTKSAMRVDNARVGFDLLSVVTHFAVHGVPTDTMFELVLDPKITSDLRSPSLSEHARKLARRLVETYRAVLTDDRIEVSLPGSLGDPGTQMQLIEEMSAVANALRGHSVQTPYR